MRDGEDEHDGDYRQHADEEDDVVRVHCQEAAKVRLDRPDRTPRIGWYR
jgi:hypothetical protein